MSAKMNVLLGIAAVVAIGAVAYFVLHGQSQPQEALNATPSALPQTASTPIAASHDATAPVANAAQSAPVDISRLNYNAESFKGAKLPERLNAMSARRQGRVFNPEEVAAALQSDTAWAPDSSAADKLNLSREDKRDGREFIQVNPLKIEALMPGDEMNLPIRQAKPDGPLRMVVDRVEDGGPGNVTWHGHLKDFDSENQVTLTRGDTLIVGGVTLPDKNYVVQIYGDIGWVVDGFTIFTGRHDAVKPGDNPSHTHTH